ncbi:hypothetical protein POTOM_001566 [Populus tomentosa]|uniref:Uncharacterized protein n=1 Tax=Populus tomentosa TaxID=118781 RepID=A0A8X8DI93_POPTO|nr:hypothetical protein POTOM_001566 [Populus tomentosa]
MPDSCREVLQGQGYFGLVLAFELKLLAMGCIPQANGTMCAVSGSGKITMHVLEKLIAYGQSQYQVSERSREVCETTQRLMLDPSTMMEQSLGVKGGDVAFPCGYQNKIDQSNAINLVNSGCRILVQVRRALGMGYLTWKSGGSFGLWMSFLLLVVLGCKFCMGEAEAEGKGIWGGEPVCRGSLEVIVGEIK